jgi:hypothetical protein
MTPASRAADQLSDPPVADLPGHSGHEGVVLNPVEEPVQIDIDDPGLACFDCLPCGFHRLVGTPSRTKAEAVVREVRFEDRSENLAQRLLKKAVSDRRHSQLTLATAGLGDRHPSGWAGSVCASIERCAESGPDGFEIRPKFGCAHAVGTRSAAIDLDAPERPGEVVSREENLPEILNSGGVRGGLGRRRIGAALCTRTRRLHRRSPDADPS